MTQWAAASSSTSAVPSMATPRDGSRFWSRPGSTAQRKCLVLRIVGGLAEKKQHGSPHKISIEMNILSINIEKYLVSEVQI